MNSDYTFRMFAYPWDFAGLLGMERLRSLRNVAGIDGLYMAASYHSMQQLSLHEQTPSIYEGEAGLFFPANEALYGEMKPHVSSLSRHADIDTLRDEMAKNGLEYHAWVVACHNSELAQRYPECAVQNAWGHRFRHALCPNNRNVRQYMLAMLQEMESRHAPASFLLESLSWMAFPHHQHAKWGIEMNEGNQLLVSLCFCPDCVKLAQDKGIDTEALRSGVLEQLRLVYQGTGGEEGIFELAGLSEYLSFREESLEAFVGDLKKRMKAEIHMAVFGSHRVSGLNADRLHDIADRIMTFSYTDDVRQTQDVLEKVLAKIPSGKLSLGLGACAPWATGRQALEANVQAAIDNGIREIGFYHYGMMTVKHTEWLRETLSLWND